LATLALVAAACGPALLAFNSPPSPTALNQAVALGTWGLVLIAMTPTGAAWRAGVGAARSALAGLLTVAAAALQACALGVLPWSLGLSGAGAVLAAGLALAAGAALGFTGALWPAFFACWVLAGIASTTVGLVQVFAPQWSDGEWIARSGLAGRAVGNLRQPNHLATLLLWSVVAVVPLLEWARAAAGARQRQLALGLLFALLLFGVLLSGSRTGLVGVTILLLWGLVDSRLSRASRALLIASPLICAAGWALLEALTVTQGGAAHLGAATRVAEGDPSSGRFAIWRDTLALIAQNPWLGVGFGEFNFAWSLTPFPQRHPAFFDHTHNLPLQLAVELGLPLALLVLSLLAWGLWQAFDRSRRVAGPEGTALRACFVMVLLMALHSQLEYPLWYAYFLLPTAFAWGLCLGANATDSSAAAATPSSSRWIRVAGIAMLVGALLMWWDYRRVVEIFAPGDDAAPLAERIAAGQRSWFFAHHADYARVTTPDAPVTEPGAFDRATHYLLDTRLMIAWAQSLAARGDVDRARHLAARLREFRNPNAKPFFEPCDDPQVTDKPFQCQPPERAYDWRDFRR
jgi:O-antigen ligase